MTTPFASSSLAILTEVPWQPRELALMIPSSPTTQNGKIVYLYEYERWGEASIERKTELVDKRKLFQLCKKYGLRDDDIIDHLKRALKRKLSE